LNTNYRLENVLTHCNS